MKAGLGGSGGCGGANAGCGGGGLNWLVASFAFQLAHEPSLPLFGLAATDVTVSGMNELAVVAVLLFMLINDVRKSMGLDLVVTVTAGTASSE